MALKWNFQRGWGFKLKNLLWEESEIRLFIVILYYIFGPVKWHIFKTFWMLLACNSICVSVEILLSGFNE